MDNIEAVGNMQYVAGKTVEPQDNLFKCRLKTKNYKCSWRIVNQNQLPVNLMH
jgi:hypothetical protein